MKRLFLAAALAAALHGQSLNLSVAPASVQAGQPATLTITFADSSGGSSTSGMQWTAVAPNTTIGTTAAGAAATAAGKTAVCNLATCLVVSPLSPLNNNVIGNGVVATVPITVPSGTAPGNIALSLSGIFAANTTGSAVSIASAPVNLLVLSKYDLNGDGVVNSADVQIAEAQADGSQQCTDGDVNGDGKCNVEDVVLEILAALGIIH